MSPRLHESRFSTDAGFDGKSLPVAERTEGRRGPFYPKIHGVPKVVVRHVLIGMIFINRNGLRLFCAPKVYGPPTTLDNRLMR